jgi:multidrug efflux pump subunit AcrA (membrane-fusion protein)
LERFEFPRSSPPEHIMRAAFAALPLAGLVAGVLFVSFGHAADDLERAVPVAEREVITVEAQHAGGVIVLGGTVMPETIVNLSAQMPGDVEFVAGSEGDAFVRGDRLVALDTTALRAKRRQAEAQLASADAGHRNALVQYGREVVSPHGQADSMMGGVPGMMSMFTDPMRSMAGRGSPGADRHSSLYGQGVQIETARNAVEQARAALREVDQALENAVSYAPFDGVILRKMVERGDIVQPGMPLVSFGDITRLQLRVDVPNSVLPAVRSNAEFLIKLDNNSAPVSATLDRVFPMAEAGAHTTTVKFNLPAGVGAHSGQYAEVLVPDPSQTAQPHPAIPESAILWRGSLPSVFLVEEHGGLRLRLIRIGDRTPDGRISVVSGIRVGDRILANPAAGTRSGS